VTEGNHPPWPSYVSGYNRLIPRLVDLGLDVYAFDLPGHGGSPGKRGLVDVRKAVEVHLAARRGLQTNGHPLFLFGHSLGGLITAGSVIVDQCRVDGVILSSPALLIEAHENKAAAE
jgi:alpha-beta hydrolase superfamily lysophospholipase